MELEKFVSGYCRQLDGSRMVEVILEDGEILEIDCCYGNCVHQGKLSKNEIYGITPKKQSVPICDTNTNSQKNGSQNIKPIESTEVFLH